MMIVRWKTFVVQRPDDDRKVENVCCSRPDDYRKVENVCRPFT